MSSGMNGYSLSGTDLDHILTHTEDLWRELRGRRLFVTGGTGFFGIWLLESLLWANDRLDLKTSATVLTRDFVGFKTKSPFLASHPAIQHCVGDIRNFEFPDGQFSHVIHGAATNATATFNNEDPLAKFETAVQGTRQTLDFAKFCGATRFLMISSGSVYCRQPEGLTHISEDYLGAPDPSDMTLALGTGKRSAEFLCAYYSQYRGLNTSVARCFSFLGPHLPLDIHYAIGNFIQDALAGRSIQIRGDGTPFRSYLYSADLMIWLWTLLFRGPNGGVYNVGSEVGLSIADIAQTVAGCFDSSIKVEIARTPSKGAPVERYVPSTRRAREQLGLKEWTDLRTAVLKTVAHIRKQGG